MIEFKAATKLFFDRATVENAIARGKLRGLKRFGALTRTIARRSIRRPTKKQRHAPPGKPPRDQTGTLKRGILFFAELDTESVVIGPVRLNKKGDAPHILEYGGRTTIPYVRDNPVQLLPRPFMRPAFTIAQERLPEIWDDAITAR